MATVKKAKTILEQIKAEFKLGDDGKLMSFFTRIEKFIKREIKTLESSKTIITSNFERDSDALNDNLQDAEEALTAAYKNVTIEKIATNSLQEDFMGRYLEGIANAESKINRIKKDLSSLEEDFNGEVKSINEQIAERQRILSTLNDEDSSEDSSAATV